MKRLDQIAARVAKATEGPWEAHCRSVSNAANDPAWPEDDFLQFHILGTDNTEVLVSGPKEVKWGRGDFYGRDADFIASARSDVPWLLDRVRELEAAVRSAEWAMDEGVCPRCWHPPSKGHDPLCGLAKALAALEEE